ncbi:MAG: bifunctional glutamate N-acetyltransferase/amino-acid acetyltransferase ArgJ [Actinomycetota bacterium]|nr:bifunctional glutamate N-acetyltransferase/amino-acid acetyltransferase ArgJ [Actinomycetota bacterium]
MALSWPRGVQSAGVAAGIKKEGALDLGVIAVDGPAAWAGTFTKNAAAAASVHWSRSLRGRPVRAITVNSGNANACTGEAGVAAVRATAEATATTLGCASAEVLVASTGPIGMQLPVDNLVAAIPAATAALGQDTASFAQSILTTDTITKTARTNGSGFEIVGVAKGAAMLAPNMATMLAFIATDADLEAEFLQQSLSRSVARSFDRVSVDACESTNDSVFLLSSGVSRVDDVRAFEAALERLCRDLAEQMVKDAEGGSRLVRIEVAGAADESTGVALARGVAASALWRAAVHGADPNWGRVLAAMGAVQRDLDLSKVDVAIGSHLVFASGAPAGSLTAARAEMVGDELTVRIRVGSGDTSVQVLTTDLSPDYVTLNATGTS